MIRINLLPDSKVTTADRGRQSLLIGMLVILLGAFAAYMLVLAPAQKKRDELLDAKKSHRAEINQKKKELQGDGRFLPYDALKKAKANEDAREKKIEKLESARINPSYFLLELSRILSGRKPIVPEPGNEVLAESMQKTWDGNRVWMTSFEEKDGEFELKGGATTEKDANEFATRLKYSVYFKDVELTSKAQKQDKESKTTYFAFTLTGKAVY